MFVNAKGKLEEASQKMREFLEYVDRESLGGDLSGRINDKVVIARENKEWEMEFMTIEWKIAEEARKARAEGRAEALRTLLKSMTPEEIEDIGFTKEDIALAQAQQL